MTLLWFLGIFIGKGTVIDYAEIFIFIFCYHYFHEMKVPKDSGHWAHSHKTPCPTERYRKNLKPNNNVTKTIVSLGNGIMRPFIF